MNRNPQPSAAPAIASHRPDQYCVTHRRAHWNYGDQACRWANLDQLADRITFGVLLACVAELGPTRRAVAAAYAAIALTDAIADEESGADARPARDS